MQKTYTVIEIYEADFGCEERPEGQETMVGIREGRRWRRNS